jgi:hypothetical protein
MRRGGEKHTSDETRAQNGIDDSMLYEISFNLINFNRNSSRGNGKANADKTSSSGKLKDANTQNFLKKHAKEIIRI